MLFLGDKAKVEFRFEDYSEKADYLKAVDGIEYRQERTNMTGGFKVMRQEVFGKDDEQTNDMHVVLLITDGVPTEDVDKLHNEVQAVKNMGIRVVGLGVTKLVCLFGEINC